MQTSQMKIMRMPQMKLEVMQMSQIKVKNILNHYQLILGSVILKKMLTLKHLLIMLLRVMRLSLSVLSQVQRLIKSRVGI